MLVCLTFGFVEQCNDKKTFVPDICAVIIRIRGGAGAAAPDNFVNTIRATETKVISCVV